MVGIKSYITRGARNACINRTGAKVDCGLVNRGRGGSRETRINEISERSRDQPEALASLHAALIVLIEIFLPIIGDVVTRNNSSV